MAWIGSMFLSFNVLKTLAHHHRHCCGALFTLVRITVLVNHHRGTNRTLRRVVVRSNIVVPQKRQHLVTILGHPL